MLIKSFQSEAIVSADITAITTDATGSQLYINSTSALDTASIASVRIFGITSANVSASETLLLDGQNNIYTLNSYKSLIEIKLILVDTAIKNSGTISVYSLKGGAVAKTNLYFNGNPSHGDSLFLGLSRSDLKIKYNFVKYARNILVLGTATPVSTTTNIQFGQTFSLRAGSTTKVFRFWDKTLAIPELADPLDGIPTSQYIPISVTEGLDSVMLAIHNAVSTNGTFMSANYKVEKFNFSAGGKTYVALGFGAASLKASTTTFTLVHIPAITALGVSAAATPAPTTPGLTITTRDNSPGAAIVPNINVTGTTTTYDNFLIAAKTPADYPMTINGFAILTMPEISIPYNPTDKAINVLVGSTTAATITNLHKAIRNGSSSINEPQTSSGERGVLWGYPSASSSVPSVQGISNPYIVSQSVAAGQMLALEDIYTTNRILPLSISSTPTIINVVMTYSYGAWIGGLNGPLHASFIATTSKLTLAKAIDLLDDTLTKNLLDAGATFVSAWIPINSFCSIYLQCNASFTGQIEASYEVAYSSLNPVQGMTSLPNLSAGNSYARAPGEGVVSNIRIKLVNTSTTQSASVNARVIY